MRAAVIFSMLTLILFGFLLLLFSNFHWHNFWSLFILLDLVVAAIVPSMCYNYNSDELAFRAGDAQINEKTFRNCRELGWSMAVVMLLFAFAIPLLAWFNSGFYFGGVLLVDLSITSITLAYLLWLHVFVFI